MQKLQTLKRETTTYIFTIDRRGDTSSIRRSIRVGQVPWGNRANSCWTKYPNNRQGLPAGNPIRRSSGGSPCLALGSPPYAQYRPGGMGGTAAKDGWGYVNRLIGGMTTC
ncbi:MAG: hypothetical protein RR224_04350 [Clostridia bacterium]